MCDGVDAYCIKKSEFSTYFKDLRCVQFPDKLNYLVTVTSFYPKNFGLQISQHIKLVSDHLGPCTLLLSQ